MNEITIEGRDKNQNPTDHKIDWVYPEIHNKEKSTLIIEMDHVRSVDGIRIKYDSERDGWIIEQASIFEWDINDNICDPDWQEVSFIGAWAREIEKE